MRNSRIHEPASGYRSSVPSTQSSNQFDEWDIFFSAQQIPSGDAVPQRYFPNDQFMPSSTPLTALSSSKFPNSQYSTGVALDDAIARNTHGPTTQPHYSATLVNREEYDPFAAIGPSTSAPAHDGRVSNRVGTALFDAHDVRYTPERSSVGRFDMRSGNEFHESRDLAMERPPLIWDSSKVYMPTKRHVNQRSTKWSREYQNPIGYPASFAGRPHSCYIRAQEQGNSEFDVDDRHYRRNSRDRGPPLSGTQREYPRSHHSRKHHYST